MASVGPEQHRALVVARVAVLVHVVARERLQTPAVTERRLITGAVIVVEQPELLDQRVVIRRHVAPELHQRRIAVALRHIAEHLVVGAVLLDDVEDVLDRRALPAVHGDRVAIVVALMIAVAAVIAIAVAVVVAIAIAGVTVWLLSRTCLVKRSSSRRPGTSRIETTPARSV